MFLFKEAYVIPLDKIPQSSWHKIKGSNVKLTEDLELIYMWAEVYS